ncbi:hypothetical protein [Cupriavidus necator]|uniref:hypothetical protein n=1 Tax=Cupriavidus necator TaxID=106590 RepID=UPI00277F1773|nr:hypothetical protein [Cupriavidus necator]MDQ0138952.1 hypothetical protein [Cupriavidus necator]
MELHWLFETPTILSIDDVVRDSLIDWPKNFRDNVLICASDFILLEIFGVAAALHDMGNKDHRWTKLEADGITAEMVRQIKLLILDAESARLKSLRAEAELMQDATCSKNHLSRRIHLHDMRGGCSEDRDWF